MTDWLPVSELRDHSEPVVYARRNPKGHKVPWSVGIAYWTVSQTWNPEAQSQENPHGFQFWKPLGEPPR